MRPPLRPVRPAAQGASCPNERGPIRPLVVGRAVANSYAATLACDYFPGSRLFRPNPLAEISITENHWWEGDFPTVIRDAHWLSPQLAIFRLGSQVLLSCTAMGQCHRLVMMTRIPQSTG